MISDIKELIRKYFFSAFKIANKENKIYIIIVAFSLINFSSGFFNTKEPYSLLFSLLQFLAWAFSLSVPYFIIKHLEKQKIEYGFMVKKTLTTARRLIIPAILVTILVLFVIMGSIFVAIQGQTAAEIQSYFKSLYTQLIDLPHQPIVFLVTIPFALVTSLFCFQPIFFTLKQKSFFISFIDSLKFSFQNMRFIYLVAFYSFFLSLFSSVYSFLSSASFNDFNFRLVFFFIYLFTQYFFLIETIAATLYFFDKDNGK